METNSIVSVALAILSGCAARLPLSVRTESAGGCLQPGAIDTTLFERIADAAIQSAAVRDPDSDGLRCAAVYQLRAGKTATAYRVYGGKGWRLGRWWTFARPSGDSAEYRNDYEICRAWNALDSITVCALKVGARFAIGPGQSAVCRNDPGYGTSDSLQAFFANHQTDLDIATCRFEPMDWR